MKQTIRKLLVLTLVLGLLVGALGGNSLTAAAANTVTRVYGSDRYQTAFQAADTLKKELGIGKFDNVIVACGTNFADALAGSYLAAVKNAPILLVRPANVAKVQEYIKANLNPGGTVYLLGGEAAVPKAMEAGMDGFTVKRLGGADRYATNLLILKEAGVGDKDIIVCTGSNFADSLSASATGLPILLVKNGLTNTQKNFLAGTSGKKIIVGGKAAVNETIEKQLSSYGAVKRLAGNSRYETSILVAQEFFENPTKAVLAYSENFPDGLAGGPLAYTINSPLILTATGKERVAVKYATGLKIKSGYVLGGSGLISDEVVKKIFSVSDEPQRTVQTLTAEKDAQLHAELETRIDSILNTKTEIVHADTYIPGKTYTGKAYYVSADGDDSNDGLSPETAWNSMGKVLQEISWGDPKVIQPGDAIFFRRGDVFRFPDWSLTCQVDNVTFSAYGEGAKPIFTASSENGSGAEKWKLVHDGADGVKIWQYYRDMRDVSMVVLNNGEVISSRVYEFWAGDGYLSCEDINWWMHEEPGVSVYDELLPLNQSMTENYNLISRPERIPTEHVGYGSYSEAGFGPLYLRCDKGNPGALFDSIEFSEYAACGLVWLDAADTVFDNISFRCNGNSYIKNANNNHEYVANTVVQNCEFAYGGGCVTYYNSYDGKTTVCPQGDGIYGIVKNARFENNYFHDSICTTVTYEADIALTGQLSGSYRVLNNVMVNTMGIRLDSTSDYLKYLDLVEIRGNHIWNTGRMDVGKYAYSEGSIVLPPNHYGECMIEDNVFYTTEKGHKMNALLDMFLYCFEEAGFTRPVLQNNTYVQYAGRNFADFISQNGEVWAMDDPDLITKVESLLGDTTSEFYIIEK